MKKNISIILKIMTVLCSFIGVVLGCFLFKQDGYSAWYKRLYYFTNLSNIWIGSIMLLALCVMFAKTAKVKRFARGIYVCKYVFTISIAITGIIFCCLLAPFAEDGYNPWSLNSLLVHVFSPTFAIVDYFIDDFHLEPKTRHLFCALIPPLCYFAFAVIMGACGVDFGKGQTYPYFFLDFNNPAKLFGFVNADPRPFLGCFYWVVLFSLIILGLAKLLARFSPASRASRKKN